MTPTPIDGRRFLELLAPGRVIHVRSGTRFGRLIRSALTRWERRLCQERGLPDPGPVWGNHDALGVQDPETGALGVGESAPRKGARMTSAFRYAEDIDAGRLQVVVLEPIDSTPRQRQEANDAWWNYEKGKPYNYLAFPRLLFKSLVGDFFPSVAGWEWADWCTQAAANSYRGVPPGLDLFQTANPTPLTTEQVAGWLPMKPGKHVTLKIVE